MVNSRYLPYIHKDRIARPSLTRVFLVLMNTCRKFIVGFFFLCAGNTSTARHFGSSSIILDPPCAYDGAMNA